MIEARSSHDKEPEVVFLEHDSQVVHNLVEVLMQVLAIDKQVERRFRCHKVFDNDPEDYEEESENDMSFTLFDSTDSRSMSRSRSASPQPKSKDPLEALIDLQLANGSFKYGSGLGFSEEELKKSCPESISNEVWITAIVIGILAKKFAKDKDLWELVANKARSAQACLSLRMHVVSMLTMQGC